MDIFKFLLHLDDYLIQIINAFGPVAYIILFLIIFAETGLVVVPFLPGDSLLFVIGTLSGSGFLNIWIVYFILLTGAILGDSVNYWIGRLVGPKVFTKENSRFFKKAYLEKTREFYAKHGGKTIILARFLPIVRTFAPFVAGIGKMRYPTFLLFSISGGFIWVSSLTFAGYFFGGIPFIKNNFEIAIIGIILVSLLPMIFELIKHKRGSKHVVKQPENTSYEDIQKTFKKEHLN